MATPIKSEPIESAGHGGSRAEPEPGQSDSHHSDPVSLEDSIMALCVANQEGVTDEMVVREYPNIDAGKRLKALQRLLSTVLPHAETSMCASGYSNRNVCGGGGVEEDVYMWGQSK